MLSDLFSESVEIVAFDCRDQHMKWVTSDVVRTYILRWLQGERYAQSYPHDIVRKVESDLSLHRSMKSEFLMWYVLDDSAKRMFKNIWNEKGLPEEGTKNYQLWEMRRQGKEWNSQPQELSDELQMRSLSDKERKEITKKRKAISAASLDLIQLNGGMQGYLEPKCCKCHKPLSAAKAYKSRQTGLAVRRR